MAQEKLALAAAALVTSPSSMVLAEVRRFYGRALDHAAMIPNPMNLVPEASTWKLEACDVNRILFVGRFNRRKGGDIVLSAFAELAKLYPNLRLTFVGPDDGIEAPQGSRVFLDDYVRSVIPESARSRIDFLGELRSDRIAELRTGHLLTVIASQFEILPYSVLEAMSFGVPIIASSVGGIPELIRHDENGLLFDCQSVPDLVAACCRLLEDHAFAARLGAQARADCGHLYDPSKIAAETVAAYHRALERHTRQGSD